MTALQQNILATALLATALSLSLLISYWLNQGSVRQQLYADNTELTVQTQKMNKLHHSLMILLPALK